MIDGANLQKYFHPEALLANKSFQSVRLPACSGAG
ncbi:hypothetical protein EVA_08949 [gut metagenome]|uniref:Uncharacterized protein n=1 Tax=gut metagenome TaxID=749906 RepID=J9G6R3_9ZZZZ